MTIGPWRQDNARTTLRPMVEFIVLLGAVIAFLLLVAAVPLELSEARRDERGRD